MPRHWDRSEQHPPAGQGSSSHNHWTENWKLSAPLPPTPTNTFPNQTNVHEAQVLKTPITCCSPAPPLTLWESRHGPVWWMPTGRFEDQFRHCGRLRTSPHSPDWRSSMARNEEEEEESFSWWPPSKHITNFMVDHTMLFLQKYFPQIHFQTARFKLKDILTNLVLLNKCVLFVFGVVLQTSYWTFISYFTTLSAASPSFGTKPAVTYKSQQTGHHLETIIQKWCDQSTEGVHLSSHELQQLKIVTGCTGCLGRGSTLVNLIAASLGMGGNTGPHPALNSHFWLQESCYG